MKSSLYNLEQSAKKCSVKRHKDTYLKICIKNHTVLIGRPKKVLDVTTDHAREASVEKYLSLLSKTIDL